jgi:hypothetical protein
LIAVEYLCLRSFALDAHAGGGGMLSSENNYKAKEAKNATMLMSTGAINDAIGDPAAAPGVLATGAGAGAFACTPLIAAALMATTTNNTAPITTLLFNACCTNAIIATTASSSSWIDEA